MQGWGRGSFQPSKNHAVEKKVNVITAAERGRQRCARREYRLSLEKDVSNLQKKLKQEVDTHKALERAFRRTLGVLPRFSPGLAPKVQELLAEVAVLEEEVINLEECIVALRQGLYNEAAYLSASKQQKEPNLNSEPVLTKDGLQRPKLPLQVRHLQNGTKAKRNPVIAKLLPPVIENKTEEGCVMGRSGIGGEPRRPAANDAIFHEKLNHRKCPGHGFQQNYNNRPALVEEVATPRIIMSFHDRNVGDQETGLEKENQQKTTDKSCKIWPQNSDTMADNTKKIPEMLAQVISSHLDDGEIMEPNLLSEEMVWCLSSIFLRLTRQGLSDCETSSTVSHSTLSSVWSFNSRNSVSYPSRDVTEEIEFIDTYKICAESIPKDIGPYQYYQEITANSLDYSRIPRSAGFLKKLMNLVEKLRMVDLRGLTHQQKLSFWINIYNVCMMHAFLEHGIPNSPHKVVALMGKAVINVGGHILSALAIEHFILRLPCDLENAEWKTRERETEGGLMRSTYGLEWPEPLVSFALCCGSWSSPAVRIYTPQEVENELEIAKNEYLQAAVGVTPTKVVIPKMLDWYMRDFAKDAESLLDWVSEQLPGALGKSMQQCLGNRQGQPVSEVVEVMPYDFSFRYLFAVQPL